MKIISVEGVVISTTPYQEKSKIINILTKEYGIIGCMSKGCKSLKSKLRLGSEKFAYGIFHMYYKENALSTLIEVDIIDHLINIKSNIETLTYLTYITELSTNVFKESNNIEVYDLFINGIKALEKGFNPKVITNILELQYLTYIGIDLNLDECVVCGSSKIATLSLNKGGYICHNCKTTEPIISEKVLKMMRLYYYVDISKITSLDIDKNIIDDINVIISEYYDEYSGVVTKSKNILKTFE